MYHQTLLTVVLALAHSSGVLGQAASSTANPLNAFIGAAGSAASAVNSAKAQETGSSASSTPTSSSAAASSSTAAAAPASGLSSRTKLNIIIPCVVIGVFLLLALAGCVYCCLRRRRRSRTSTQIPDEEVSNWRQPSNPGRNYSPVRDQTLVPNMSQQPTVPLMAAMGGRPSTQDHPAYREENPFVPVPPLPRKSAPNSRPGLTDGTIAGADAYVGAPRSPGGRRRKSSSRSRSSSDTGLNSSYNKYRDDRTSLPSYNEPNRTSTPFGLGGSAEPYSGQGPDHRYNVIGQPYSDMHVHQLVNDKPSHALHEAPYVAPDLVQPRYSTPPMVPNRSSRRNNMNESSYNSSSTPSDLTSNTSGSGSGESWRTSQMAPSPQRPHAPWEDREHRWSGSNRERSYSKSPRQSMSNTPRPSLNGQQKRLRFSDFEHHDVDENHRYSQGVGQAI